MKRSDGYYEKKPYISKYHAQDSIGPQVGWPAVFIVCALILFFEYLVPYDLFGTSFDQLPDTRSELGGGPYTVDSPNVQTRLHAMNEIGIIMARQNSYKEARAKLEHDQNRAFMAIDQLSNMVKHDLNEVGPDGKTRMERSNEIAGEMVLKAEKLAEN